MPLFWAAWKTIIEEPPLRKPSPPSKVENANWSNAMSQINVLAGAALNLRSLEGKAAAHYQLNLGHSRCGLWNGPAGIGIRTGGEGVRPSPPPFFNQISVTTPARAPPRGDRSRRHAWPHG